MVWFRHLIQFLGEALSEKDGAEMADRMAMCPYCNSVHKLVKTVNAVNEVWKLFSHDIGIRSSGFAADALNRVDCRGSNSVVEINKLPVNHHIDAKKDE